MADNIHITNVSISANLSIASIKSEKISVEIETHFARPFQNYEYEMRQSVVALSSSTAFRAAHPRLPNEKTIPYIDRLHQLANSELLKASPIPIVRLGCIIVGRNSSKIVEDELRPRFTYWHYRSGKIIDFCCIGFSAAGDAASDEEFVKAIKLFEGEINWRYSGETDVLLLNFSYDKSRDVAVPDWSNVIQITLERAIEDKAVPNATALLEDIIRFAETYKGRNPASDFSDAMARRLFFSAFKAFLLSLIPESLREQTKKALHFYTKDLG